MDTRLSCNPANVAVDDASSLISVVLAGQTALEFVHELSIDWLEKGSNFVADRKLCEKFNQCSDTIDHMFNRIGEAMGTIEHLPSETREWILDMYSLFPKWLSEKLLLKEYIMCTEMNLNMQAQEN